MKQFSRLLTALLSVVLLSAIVAARSDSAKFEGTIVLAISDSTTRHHFSLYGYHRNTTPGLMKTKSDLLVLTDTISPSMIPGESTRQILSGGPEPSMHPGLIKLLEQSGFKTFSFSNQNFDEKVLPSLTNALNDKAERKFIVWKLGSIGEPHCKSVPQKYQTLRIEDGLGLKYFGNAENRSEQVNCYDHSIRYLDSNLVSILEMMKKRREPMIMIYVADHGADPDQSKQPMHYSPMEVEIPHIWYFNPAAKIKYSSEYGELRVNLSKPFLSSDLYPTILDLVKLTVEKQRSLVAKGYTSFGRRISLQGKDRFIAYDQDGVPNQKDYLDLTRLTLDQIRKSDPKAYSKVWAHRVNTLGKLMEAKRSFAGVEFDVVYDQSSRKFMIYHPPDSDIGLELGEYLNATKGNPALRFWFDWKNAEPASFESSLSELNRLDSVHKIKQRMIVETDGGAIFPELRKLARNGWMHSYYLPTDDIIRCSKSNPSRDCEEIAQSAVKAANEVGAQFVSFDYNGYPFVRNHQKAFSNFKHLTWNTDVKITALKDRSQFQKTLQAFECYLVSFPSRYYH